MRRPPKFTLKLFGQLLAETGKAWVADKAPRMGAALAYYTAFSLAPLLVLAFSVLSLFYTKHGDAVKNITDQARNTIGPRAVEAVQGILEHASSPKTASWSALVSLVILLFSASSAFGELQDSLNQIWRVPPHKQPLLAMIRQRLLSFGMVLVLGFFMLASLILSAVAEMLSHWIRVPFPTVRIEITNNVVSFLVFSALFATIFRLLPDVPLRWRDVIPGAILSTSLFLVGKILLGWYVGISTTTFSSYGAAGSFVIILLWVYYSAQILYLGAEFTRAYTKRYGSQRQERA